MTHYVKKDDILTFRNTSRTVKVVGAYSKVVLYRSEGLIAEATAAHFVETSRSPEHSRGSFRLEV